MHQTVSRADQGLVCSILYMIWLKNPFLPQNTLRSHRRDAVWKARASPTSVPDRPPGGLKSLWPTRRLQFSLTPSRKLGPFGKTTREDIIHDRSNGGVPPRLFSSLWIHFIIFRSNSMTRDHYHSGWASFRPVIRMTSSVGGSVFVFLITKKSH